MNAKVVDSSREFISLLSTKDNLLPLGFVRKADDSPDDDEEDMMDVMDEFLSKISVILLSLLEGEEDIEICQKMAFSISIEDIKDRMLNVFGVFLHSIKLFPVTKLKDDQDENTPLKVLSVENSNNFLSDVSVNRVNRKLKGDSFDGVLSEAFAIYILLLTLAETIPSAKQWVQKDFFTVDEWKVFEFLRQNVARIEVAVDGVLQRVYFPIRPTCHFISVKSRKALMQSINRESQQSKVTELMEAIPDLIDEMVHNEQLESATIQITPKLMAQLKDFSNLVGLVISLAQVIFLIRVDNYTQREMPIYITRLVFYLGIVQGISSFTLCIFYIINKYTLVTKSGWRNFVENNKRTAAKIPENEERLNVQEMSIEQTHLILMAKGIEAEEFNIGEKPDFGNRFT